MNKAFKVSRSQGYKPDLRQVREGETKIINSCPHLVSGKRNKKKTSHRKAKASGGQPDLPSKSQDSQRCTEKACLEKPNKQNSKARLGKPDIHYINSCSFLKEQV